MQFPSFLKQRHTMARQWAIFKTNISDSELIIKELSHLLSILLM